MFCQGLPHGHGGCLQSGQILIWLSGLRGTDSCIAIVAVKIVHVGVLILDHKNMPIWNREWAWFDVRKAPSGEGVFSTAFGRPLSNGYRYKNVNPPLDLQLRARPRGRIFTPPRSHEEAGPEGEDKRREASRFQNRESRPAQKIKPGCM